MLEFLQYSLKRRISIRRLSQKSFSRPEGHAIPWANIPKFGQDMPDGDYMYCTTFDGLFEQAYDNYHGWVGGKAGDMADNTYTADPIFYSYHANIDFQSLFDSFCLGSGS